MLKDVVDVKPLDGYRLSLRFEDGAQGEVDVAELIAFTGVLPRCATKPFSIKRALTRRWGRSSGQTAATSPRTCSTPRPRVSRCPTSRRSGAAGRARVGQAAAVCLQPRRCDLDYPCN